MTSYAKCSEEKVQGGGNWEDGVGGCQSGAGETHLPVSGSPSALSWSSPTSPPLTLAQEEEFTPPHAHPKTDQQTLRPSLILEPLRSDSTSSGHVL